jgi:DNA-nicking Smr family endonuclease
MTRRRAPGPVPDEEDLEAFRRAVARARPLSVDRVHHPPVHRPATPRARPAPDPSPPGLPDKAWPEAAPGDVLSFARDGVQQRVLRRLRSGRMRAEAELDLHGLTVPAARARIEHFLAECRRREVRCVRIVHGKGFGSSRGGGAVLKAAVDRWLRLHEGALAFCSALPADGGTGAVYVLLRH